MSVNNNEIISFEGNDADLKAIIDDLDAAFAGLEAQITSSMTTSSDATQILSTSIGELDTVLLSSADATAAFNSILGETQVTFASLADATMYASQQMAMLTSTDGEAEVSFTSLADAMAYADSQLALYSDGVLAAAASTDTLTVAQTASTDVTKKSAVASEAAAVAHKKNKEGLDLLGGAADAASGLLEKLKFVLMATGLAELAVGAFSVKWAGDFERNVTKLYTTAGEAHDALKMVGDGMLNMSSSVGTGAIKLSEAMYWIESGGLHGAKALDALRIAAEAAKAENANLDKVSIALAASLNAYAGSGMSTVQVMNTLTAATGQGMMTFEQLSGSLASVLPAAAKFHVSLTDVTAALADMTAQGDPAEQAATHLKQVLLALEAPSKIGASALKSVGLTSSEVANEMKVSLPGALQMITDAVGKKFPEGSAEYNQAIKNIAGGSKQMMGFLELTGQHMGAFVNNVHKISSAVKEGGNNLMGWADIQQTFNFKLDAAKASVEQLFISLGTRLLPIIGNLLSIITPLIQRFSDWITKADGLSAIIKQVGQAFHTVFDTITYPINQATQVIVKLNDTFDHASGIIHTVNNALTPLKDTFDHASAVIHSTTQAAQPLVDTFDRASGVIHSTTKAAAPMLDAFDRASSVMKTTQTGAHGATQAINPFVAIFQNVANAIKIAIAAFQWVSGAIHTVQEVFNSLRPTLQQIGTFLATTFAPTLQQLKTTLTTQLIPAWNDLVTSIRPLLPTLIPMAEALGIVVVGAIMLFVKVLGIVLPLVIQVFGGMVRIISGAISTVAGLITFFVDLATGHFERLGTDLGAIWTGIKGIFIGAWSVIDAITVGTLSRMVSFIEGAVHDLVAPFQWLYDTLVGHSIIPDMVNGIVNWFEQLPGRALSAIQGLASQLVGFFGGLANQALSWGADIINNIVSGLQNGIGKVKDVVNNIASTISSVLKHSKPEKGPLADDDVWMHHFGDNLVTGLNAQVARVHGASLNIASAISLPNLNGASTSNTSSNNNDNVLQQLLQEQRKTNMLLQALQHLTNGGINIGNMSLGGINDLATLQQQLNNHGGTLLEYGGRVGTIY